MTSTGRELLQSEELYHQIIGDIKDEMIIATHTEALKYQADYVWVSIGPGRMMEVQTVRWAIRNHMRAALL